MTQEFQEVDPRFEAWFAKQMKRVDMPDPAFLKAWTRLAWKEALKTEQTTADQAPAAGASEGESAWSEVRAHVDANLGLYRRVVADRIKPGSLDAAVAAIKAKRDYAKSCDLVGYKHGQFVQTGMQVGGTPTLKAIGYCVQVRKRCGQYGSDMVFLRHPDGKLTVHENQSFYALSAEDEALIRPFFKVLPEQEEPDLGYRCCDGIHEVGFIIERSASQPSPAQPVMITTMTPCADGSVKQTITALG